MDEYGKGTATVCWNMYTDAHTHTLTLIEGLCGLLKVDGLALLTASLRYWLAKGPMSPSVLVSTHFHGLVKQNLLPDTDHVEYLVCMNTLPLRVQ